MTDTTMPANHKADLQARIARLDQKINEVKCEIANWQDKLDELEDEYEQEAMESLLTKRKRT